MRVVILALTILISSISLLKSIDSTECVDINDVKFCQSLSEYWQPFQQAITEGCNTLLEYFEELFHLSDSPHKFKYDLTLVGFVNSADGIGKLPILFKECLGDRVKINFLSTRNIPAELEDAQLGLPRFDPANKNDVAAVSMLTDILADKICDIYKKVPNSPIKIAYTMFESTEIPHKWVQILNKKFDIAVVPDKFLVDVYRTCGVQIPIFVLPLPLKLNEFLKVKQSKAPHTPFVFGTSGGFWKRKNHKRVLEAFAAEFGNSSDVKLILHGRFGEEALIKELADKIAEYKLTNVELIVKSYSHEEYLEFFKSLDCYVLLSQGEGFSITPREALACAKPCIVTNNTAQKSICDSGTVRAVPSNILIPAVYDCHYDSGNYGCNHIKSFFHHDDNIPCNVTDTNDEEIDAYPEPASFGYQFDCTVQDARAAMRDVYEHYNYHLAKASQGREWVKRYLPENLQKKYLNLIKPDSIILGEENFIIDQFFMTNSQALYNKYQCVLG